MNLRNVLLTWTYLFFWCLMLIMTHNAKLIQISYRTNFWVLTCKKKGKIFVSFLLSAQLFFSFSASKVCQLLTGKQNTKQPEKIKNMILQQKQNSNWSSKVMFLSKFMTTTPPVLQKVINVITQITAPSPPTNLQNDDVIYICCLIEKEIWLDMPYSLRKQKNCKILSNLYILAVVAVHID